jgi:hypothetical protein
MQAPMISARTVLTTLAIVFALVVAATPQITTATDEPDEFSNCRSGRFATYLECIQTKIGADTEREAAAATQIAIAPGSLDFFLFIELNTWGQDFVFAPQSTPYFPSPVHG